eukprot:GEMP01011671.1.p1 GENE.GEMP01011671.1~~GEMP01011671.1.p1  ORF type:complete len:627 (+),score=162.06 GEMP01011671.1:106-1986(+)
MAKLRVKRRKNQPKKKRAAKREPSYSSSRGSSCSDDRSKSSGSYSSSGSSSRSWSASDSPGSTSGEDIKEYRKGGYHPVEPFQLYAGRYRVLGKLGSGAFSTVWLCSDEKAKELELYAMKVCKSSRSVCEQTLDEIKLLDALDSPYCMAMKNHFWHSGPNGNHKCLIFDLMGENLLALVRHFNDEGLPLRWVKKIAYDTLHGLAHCHARQVIHTDIKLENVLVTRHDFAELIQEADAALAVFRKREEIVSKQKVDTSNMTKSQKKRLKKKQKKQAASAADTNAAAADTNAAAAETVEADDGEPDDDPQAADEDVLPPLPSPPTRQKNRLDMLKLRDLHCKLTDFGNGCWVQKHFTEEIQTRQYRSPEALLGQTYDATTDLWSAACMFFELLTGEFLFAPRSSKKWCRDEDHIALIIELLGNYPPIDWALKGRYGKQLLSNDGKPKRIKKLKFWSLYEVMVEKYGMGPEESQEFCDFLLPMLEWLPENRITAEEVLKHPWLKDANDEDEHADMCASAYISRTRHQSDSSDGETDEDYDDDDEEEEEEEEEEEDGEADDENDEEASPTSEAKPVAEAKAAAVKEADKSQGGAEDEVRETSATSAGGSVIHAATPQCLSPSALNDDEFH